MLENPFKYSDDNKRYQTQNYYLKKHFGQKVIKLSLNGGFTCPNRDGKRGLGGCTYCSDSYSGDFAGNPEHSILAQLEEQKSRLSGKWGEGLYIPYFQAGTNTYASLEILKKMYETALSFENVVGLALATRADCISDECIDYLAELSGRTYLTVELGLQTIYDSTADYINRCHSYKEFLDTYKKLSHRGINVCVHIINGLPNETRGMMINTAREVAKLKPHSVKIHMLHIIKGTAIQKQYDNREFSLLSLEEYINIVCDQLELMPAETIIQRVTGDGNKETLVAPIWTLKKFVVMNEIDKEFLRRNSHQSKYYIH